MDDFKTLTLGMRAEYERFRAAFGIPSSDYSFTNAWSWGPSYGLKAAFRGSYVLLRQEKPFTAYWCPLADWTGFDPASVPEFASSESVRVCRVPSDLVPVFMQAFGGRAECIETRGQWEYLYARSDLADLPGNRYHKKKNHVNAYRKAYGENFRLFSEEGGERFDALAFQEDWCRTNGCEESESLMAESIALNKILREWDSLPGLVGGGLYHEGVMTSFAVGEALDSENFVVHFEKACPLYKGSYQAINNVFARRAAEGFATINREQDLDEEGLRQAKETYLPSGFLKKSFLVIS